MSEKEKMIKGENYNPRDSELRTDRIRAKNLCLKYNSLTYEQEDEKKTILKELIGTDNCIIEPNFFCDYGYNIKFNGFVYINHNSVFLDCAPITIGKNTFIGPNCGFYTAIHPINAKERIKAIETAKPINIGENVWIGGNVTILPGVTIGNNCVIGAGSVVTKNIEENVVAVGNPCKIIKNIENN